MISPEKSRHCQTWLKELLIEWKLTAKAELNCEIYKSWRKYRKIKSVLVIRTALWTEKVGCCLEHCRSWKDTLGKLDTGGHLIRVLNVRSVTDGGNLCPLWLVILKSVRLNIGDTLWLQYSWPWDVVSYALLAVVPWNGLDHSRRKARLRVYLKCRRKNFAMTSIVYLSSNRS